MVREFLLFLFNRFELFECVSFKPQSFWILDCFEKTKRPINKEIKTKSTFNIHGCHRVFAVNIDICANACASANAKSWQTHKVNYAQEQTMPCRRGLLRPVMDSCFMQRFLELNPFGKILFVFTFSSSVSVCLLLFALTLAHSLSRSLSIWIWLCAIAHTHTHRSTYAKFICFDWKFTLDSSSI